MIVIITMLGAHALSLFVSFHCIKTHLSIKHNLKNHYYSSVYSQQSSEIIPQALAVGNAKLIQVE